MDVDTGFPERLPNAGAAPVPFSRGSKHGVIRRTQEVAWDVVVDGRVRAHLAVFEGVYALRLYDEHGTTDTDPDWKALIARNL